MNWKSSGIAASLLALVCVYCLSMFYVGQNWFSENRVNRSEKTIIRIAHSVNDPRVLDAFAGVIRRYERLHPDRSVETQAIPQRAYEQWAVTQLMGGTPPDVIQVLGTSGPWATTAQQYLTPLTLQVNETNQYNKGTKLEDLSWRDTFIDQMRGGYFLHLMEFYGVPFTVGTTRLIYNRDLLREITGSEDAPGNFRQWMEMCDRIRQHSRTQKLPIYAVGVSVEDDLVSRYYPTLTGGLMDRFDPHLWGVPSRWVSYYWNVTETFSLKHVRLRAAFQMLREIYRNVQPSFITDRLEQKRMLFLQNRVVMIVSDTRDFGFFRDNADFEVGVFDFPQVNSDDPVYGKYFEGPVAEGIASTLTFGVPDSSKLKSEAIDFLRFCTSVDNNERFCRRLGWYPAIHGAQVSADLDAFRPVTGGVISYPVLTLSSGAILLFYEQNLPLFLDGQLAYEEFADGLHQQWLSKGWEDIQRRMNKNIGFRRITEYNITKARAKMLFPEAGRFEAGRVTGTCTAYELGLEINEIQDVAVNENQYLFNRIDRSDYQYPFFPKAGDR